MQFFLKILISNVQNGPLGISESVFSIDGRVLTELDSSITTNTFEICVYLKDWFDIEKRE